MVFFIAEISSNHNQDLDRSLSIIEAAKSSGFDAVKFQLFEVEQLFSSEVLAVSETHRARTKLELPPSFLEPLSDRAKRLGIQFSVTPFSLATVEQSGDFVDFFKVASYELLWADLLAALAKTGKPVISSTGMADLSEVQRAVEVLRTEGCREVSLLHCLSSYPAPSEETNLAAIETLREEFGVKVGWSDHTRNSGVIYRAVHHWGAEIVEMHLDLDGEGFEFKPGHCWLPGEASKVIRDVRDGLAADGNGVKEPAPSELPDREWRADPADGLRPLKHVRAEWRAKN